MGAELDGQRDRRQAYLKNKDNLLKTNLNNIPQTYGVKVDIGPHLNEDDFSGLLKKQAKEHYDRVMENHVPGKGGFTVTVLDNKGTILTQYTYSHEELTTVKIDKIKDPELQESIREALEI